MNAEAFADVLDSIAKAIRTLPTGVAPARVLSPAPAPMPAPPPPVFVAARGPESVAETPPEPEPAPPVAQEPAPAAGLTISAWLVTYRTIIKDRNYKAQTIKNRESCVKFLEAQLGARPLRAIKPHEITTMLKRCSPHKAGRVLFELRDVFGEAIANDEADSNPASHVKAPPAPGLRKRLTLDVWKSMLALADAGPQRWVHALLLLAIATGQRRADLAKMKFTDVVDGHLRVEQQKKARKKVGARLAIPLTLRLDATGMTLADVIEHCRAIGKPGDCLLRQASGRTIELSSLTARFHECIVAVCGEEAYKQFEWPSLHEVRSLSARTYMAEGMAAETVQKLLGHKHEEMTQLYLDDRGLTEAEWKLVAA